MNMAFQISLKLPQIILNQNSISLFTTNRKQQ